MSRRKIFRALLALAMKKKPDLTVVGPDLPLALGVVDLFQQHGLRIWGPNRQAAQFESSKVFSQNFMAAHGIPTGARRQFHRRQGGPGFRLSLWTANALSKRTGWPWARAC